MVSKDSKADRFELTTPRRYPVTVPAGSRTAVNLTAIRPGSDPIEADNQIRGRLIFGVGPGP